MPLNSMRPGDTGSANVGVTTHTGGVSGPAHVGSMAAPPFGKTGDTGGAAGPAHVGYTGGGGMGMSYLINNLGLPAVGHDLADAVLGQTKMEKRPRSKESNSEFDGIDGNSGKDSDMSHDSEFESDQSESGSTRNGARSVRSFAPARRAGQSRTRIPRKKRRLRQVIHVPVVLQDDQYKLKCSACLVSIHERSPVAPKPEYGDYFPWSLYTKKYHSETQELQCRFPKGLFCAFCRNAYQSAGLAAKFQKTLSQFAADITVVGSAVARYHPEFLALRAKYIKALQRSDDSAAPGFDGDEDDSRPGGSRVKKVAMQGLRDEATQTLAAIEQKGMRDEAPKERFVEEKRWCEKKLGTRPSDPPVKALFNGQWLVGWWIEPEEIWHTRTFYSDKNTTNHRFIADNSGELGKERIENETAAVHASFDKGKAAVMASRVQVELPVQNTANDVLAALRAAGIDIPEAPAPEHEAEPGLPNLPSGNGTRPTEIEDDQEPEVLNFDGFFGCVPEDASASSGRGAKDRSATTASAGAGQNKSAATANSSAGQKKSAGLGAIPTAATGSNASLGTGTGIKPTGHAPVDTKLSATMGSLRPSGPAVVGAATGGSLRPSGPAVVGAATGGSLRPSGPAVVGAATGAGRSASSGVGSNTLSGPAVVARATASAADAGKSKKPERQAPVEHDGRAMRFKEALYENEAKRHPIMGIATAILRAEFGLRSAAEKEDVKKRVDECRKKNTEAKELCKKMTARANAVTDETRKFCATELARLDNDYTDTQVLANLFAIWVKEPISTSEWLDNFDACEKRGIVMDGVGITKLRFDLRIKQYMAYSQVSVPIYTYTHQLSSEASTLCSEALGSPGRVGATREAPRRT